MATETGAVEDVFWFAERVVAAAANDVENDDLPQPSDLIRQDRAAVRRAALEETLRLAEAHLARHFVMENISAHEFDAHYAVRDLRDDIRALLAQEKAD